MQSRRKGKLKTAAEAAAAAIIAFFALWIYGAILDKHSADHSEWNSLTEEERNEALYQRYIRGF